MAGVEPWDGTPPEGGQDSIHLLSDRGAAPSPARYDPALGLWWVKPGVPFPIPDMQSCGFRYVGPTETAEVIPIISKRPMRFSHEFECDSCGHQVFSAVHYGPIRTCLDCQFKKEHGLPIERAKA